MAKKYDHDKQGRPADKSKSERPAADRRPRIAVNSPNPDENRSYPRSDRFKKQSRSDQDERPRRYESREKPGEWAGRSAPTDNKRPFVRKDGDKRWEGSRASSDDKRPFVKKDGDRDRTDRLNPSAPRGRGGLKPRSESDNRFSSSDGFKQRESRTNRTAATKGGDRREVRENQAKPGRKPLYDPEKMKDKLPPKVRTKVEKKESKHTDGTIRLNRFIANAGVCSRREADELIAAGDVTVNGTVVTEMGSRVQTTDVVTFKGKLLERENFAYVLLNKPKDYLTTTDDPAERKTVMDLVAEACDERIYPIGRLDRKTTGLLLLTNDGKLAEKLSHPAGNVAKIYQAELDKPITEAHFNAIVQGIELEDGFVKVDELALVTPDAEVVGIQIHSGKNRIVRRIFEHFGYTVTKLDRTVYAGLNKKELPRGTWRHLTEKEVIKLKYLT